MSGARDGYNLRMRAHVRRSSAPRAPRRAGVLCAALACLAAACAVSPPRPAPPVSPEASAAFAEARRLASDGATLDGATQDDDALRAALDRALALEPAWIAPARLADDLRRRALRGPEVWGERRAALLDDPDDARDQYLAGRLEGSDGARRFDHAARLDPRSAWAHHGRAWVASLDGDAARAMQHEARAVRLAREPWEAAFFRVRFAEYAMDAREPDAALASLRDPLARVGLSRADRVWLEVETALVELQQARREAVRAGYERGLALLRQADPDDEDLRRLVERMAFAGFDSDPGRRALHLALASRPGAYRAEMRGRLWLLDGESALGMALLSPAAEEEGEDAPSLSRAAAFHLRRFDEAVADWAAGLPDHVLDADGDPRDPRVRAVVTAARATADGATAAELAALGDALVAAGWFEEAEDVARALATDDGDGAADPAGGLALESRAMAGARLVQVLRDSLSGRGDVDTALPDVLAPPDTTPPAPSTPTAPRDRGVAPREADGRDPLTRWLDGLAPAFARAHEALGGETDVDRVRASFAASPRSGYGAIGALLHPGLRFSSADERAGLGRAGEPVPGIADELARIGRFATVGTLIGRGLDGMILRSLLVEEQSGELLGVPWSGTIAICEGVDSHGRNGNGNYRISGAALHEGYWIELSAVRRDHARWTSLDEWFDEPGGADRVRRALEVTGVPLSVSPTTPDARARERRALKPSLEQSRRVRLAVLAERRAAGEPGVSLTEVVECVAVHEQGHLCDRTRFLPLHENLGRAMLLVMDNGFSPIAIQQQLEYRAQLTAMCELDEPRLAFADVVQSAEVETDGPLPHGRAYRELLGDFLRVLDTRLARDPERWSMLDPDRTLMHQLHRLSGEDVREIALLLARAEGL